MITLKLIALTVTIVLALKVALSKDMLLDKLGVWLEQKSDKEKIYNLFICPFCMGTLQVFTAHAFAFGLNVLPLEFNWQLIIRIPLVIFASSFISGNLWNLYETVNRIKEKNEVEAEYYNSLFENKD